MSSDYSIMLHGVLADQRFWILYVLACFASLLWVGFAAMQGVMIVAGLFITLAVFGVSAILCVMLITDLKNNAIVGTGVSLSNQAPD